MRYKDTPIKFSNDEKGQDAFLRNFYNQLSEVVFDFHNYAKENIEYFLYQNDTTKQGKPMSKTVTSGIAPINQKIDQALDSTNLASGTGSQFVSETVYNGVAWHKLVETYFTPNRKTEMLKTFQWLFISVYSPETKYDDKIEQVRTVDLWFRDEEENPIDEQHVFPTKSYFTMSEVIINKPEDLIPQNIKRGEVIAGVYGAYEIPLLEVANVALDLTDDMSIKASDYGYEGMKEVVVEKPATAVPENIKNGVDIGGVVGTLVSIPDYLGKRINNTAGDYYTYSSNETMTLCSYAFAYDKNITSATLNNVTALDGGFTFYNCTNLTSVSLNGITTSLGNNSSIFKNCTSLTNVSLPNITGMGAEMFRGCTSLETISLPNCTGSGTTIFEGCTNLKNVNLPLFSNVNVSNGFANCTSLQTITLPSATGSLGSTIFDNCTSLQTVDLGTANTSGVGYMTASCFRNCTNLTHLWLRGTTVATANATNTFSGVTGPVTVHVPANRLTNYQNNTVWATLVTNGVVILTAI